MYCAEKYHQQRILIYTLKESVKFQATLNKSWKIYASNKNIVYPYVCVKKKDGWDRENSTSPRSCIAAYTQEDYSTLPWYEESDKGNTYR